MTEKKADWKERVLLLMREKSKSPQGASDVLADILIAAMGKRIGRPRSYGRTAKIDTENVVRATYVDPRGVLFPDWPITTVKTLSKALEKLAKDANLDDAEAVALFKLVRDWISVNENALLLPNLGESK